MSAPTLLAHLAYQIITPVTKKGRYSDEYVLFGDYMPCAQFLYETSAILGFTFRDRLAVFVELFCEAGREANLISALAESAASRLSGLPQEPQDFFDMFFKPEVERLMKVMRDAGITKCSEWLDFPKVAKQRMRCADIFSRLQSTAPEGIGLGSSYPDLTERLLSHAEDSETWSRFRAHGLDIPASPPKQKSIPERQAEATSMIRPYVEKVRPDLLAKLGLPPTNG